MAKIRARVAGLAAMVVLTAASVAPASAEFFGCNDKPGKVLYSYSGTPGQRYSSPRSSARVRYTHEFAAQTTRPRITIHPRTTRSAQRHCRSWLAKEYRVSGPVIVPRMQCWWQ